MSWSGASVSSAKFLCIFCSVTCPSTPLACSPIELCSPILLLGLHSAKQETSLLSAANHLSPCYLTSCMAFIFALRNRAFLRGQLYQLLGFRVSLLRKISTAIIHFTCFL